MREPIIAGFMLVIIGFFMAFVSKISCEIRITKKNFSYSFERSSFKLMPFDLVECVSRANARNKKTPAMRVGGTGSRQVYRSNR